jgi:hypothetical protein
MKVIMAELLQLTHMKLCYELICVNDGQNHGNFYQNFKQEVRFILTGNFYFDLKCVLIYIAMNSNTNFESKQIRMIFTK